MHLRYLNTLETFMANSHALYKGTSQIVSLLHLNYKPSAEQVEEAFDQCCRDHPLLLAKITIKNKKWCFQTGSKAVSRFEALKFEEELTNLDLFLENEVNDVIDHTKSLTKLKLVYLTKNKGCLLILIQHHAITDMYSAQKILKNILNNLVITPVDIDIASEKLPVWKKIDASEQIDCKSDRKNDIKSELAYALKKICSDTPVKGTSVHSWMIDRHQIPVLTQYARELDGTLNSLLTVILSIGVMELLNIYKINTYSAVTYRKQNAFENRLGCLFDIANIGVRAWDIDDSVRRFEREMRYIQEHVNFDFETDSQIPAQARAQNLSVQKIISLCEGLRFMHVGCVDHFEVNSAIDVLAYRVVTNHIADKALFTFFTSFCKGNLLISVVSSQLILKKEMVMAFINNINKHIYTIINKTTQETL